jgi:hypothetical protein
MIGDLVSKWSLEGPLDLQQVRRGDEVDMVLRGIRPIPPLVPLLFSEAINHLRAAMDNTVWYLVDREHGPLNGFAARQVAMPIMTKEKTLDDWVKKRQAAGFSALGPNTVLGKRIRSLQPFSDSATSIPSKTPLLAHLLGEEVEDVHPLRLLQEYSNADKHRSIRVAVARTTSSRHDEPFMGQDRTFKELRVGDVLARTTWGNLVMFDSSTAAIVERPEPFNAPVSPVKELSLLNRYVSQVAIPVLVTGLQQPRSLPPSVDLGDNGRSDHERLCDGRWDDAEARLAPVIAERFAEAMNRVAQIPDVVDDPGDSH